MAVFAVVAIVSAVALLPFLNKTMWRDEGASLYSAHLSWTGLWHQSLVVDRVVLAYYAILHIWLELSGGIQWARALSLVAYALIIFVVAVLARRIAGFWCGLLAAVITCTNPLMITEALEARPYALATLTSLLAIAALWNWTDREELRWLWLFSILSIVTMMLQLFIVLAPLSVLAACVVMKPEVFRCQWRRLFAPVGMLAAALVALVSLVAHQQGQVYWISGLSASSFLGDIKGPASPALGHPFYSTLIAAIALLAIAGCLYGWRQHSLHLCRFQVARFVACLSWAIVPTVVLIVITAVKPVYYDRYVTASVPGMAIALALLIVFAYRTLETQSTPKGIVVGVAALAVLIILIANSVTAGSSQWENLRGAATYIEGNAEPTSEISLPDHSITTGIEYYFDHAHSTLRLWPQLSVQPYIEGLDLRDGAGAFARAPRDVWLVDDGSVQQLKGFLSALRRHGYVRVSTWPLKGVTVIHLRRD
jgi:mannosyltransferase